jgi:bacterioferritin
MDMTATARAGEPRAKGHVELVETLNRMLAQEHACAIRYATHAAMLTGPHREAVSARLLEIAADEALHALKLRERICALGGTPTMKVEAHDLIAATTLEAILEVNIREERSAIDLYAGIFATIPGSDAILHATIEDILRDEQEHLEELRRLRPAE